MNAILLALLAITVWAFLVYLIVLFVRGGKVSEHIERGRYSDRRVPTDHDQRGGR